MKIFINIPLVYTQRLAMSIDKYMYRTGVIRWMTLKRK